VKSSRLLAFGCVGTLALVAALSLSANPATAQAAPPSFVVVMTDDMGKRQLRALPRVRGLIGDAGTTFARAYVETPICAPSRASFLTGRMAHNHGVVSVNTSGTLIRPLEPDTFAARLQAAGYRTVYFGKYINGYRGTYAPEAQVVIDGNKVPVPGHADYWMSRQVAEIIRATPATTPLLIVINTSAPHKPHVPLPEHTGLFAGAQVPRTPAFNEVDISDKPRFLRPDLLTPDQIQALDASWAASLEELQTVDALVARVHGALRDNGRLSSSYLMFTSDHGIHFGEHRQKEDKTQPWETDIGVPLLVRGPGVPRRVDEESIVGLVDIGPTLLDLAGVSAAGADGISFSRALHGGVGPRTAMPIAFWGQVSPYVLTWRGVRSKRYTWVEYHNGAEMLFDNRRDPHQLENLAASPQKAERRAALKARTARLFACVGAQACKG
jgi:N-acetylglucosamine-6-sulfatase